MNQYSIQLERYDGPRSRYKCPRCDHDRRFTRYIDIITEEYISSDVGRCDRVDKCGYHYTPKQYFEDNKVYLSDHAKAQRAKAIKELPKRKILLPDFTPLEVVQKSIKGMQQNDLMKFLYSVFDQEKVNRVAINYLLGKYERWNTSNPVFWQIDKAGKVRTGKIIGYNSTTGKRIKKPFSHINWIHSILSKEKKKPYNLSQCLFGEHLLTQYKEMIVGLVESEKTALIASICFPDILWLATGGKENMKPKKMECLMKRKVVLYPDLGAYEQWSQKADELSESIPDITVSDLLHRVAPISHKNQGFDLADYCLLDHAGIR